ncbi:MAG: sulfite exporter TauE/SafE family protein [Thermoleophilia bacterium]|nr:sulfite exporter TauE/SafE family protein [Thermoleophilia bacterium]
MDVSNLPAAAALGVSAAAGVVSFLSPCVAPLLPGYVAFIAGGADDEHSALPRAIGFVAGFVILFALLGATAAAVSRALPDRGYLELVGGLVVALIGLAMAFDKPIVPASFVRRTQQRATAGGSPRTALAAIPVGAAFAVAWSPCIGPALSAILTLAAGNSRPTYGAVLLVAYGIGLGIPFLLGAIALDRVQVVSRALRRHTRAINLVGGVLLVALGIAIATGQFGVVTAHLARLTPGWL